MAAPKCFSSLQVFICIITSVNATLMVTLPVYNQTKTVSKAMIKPDLPALSEFTACFWFNGKPDDDALTQDWILTFALPASINAIMVGFETTMKFLFIRGSNKFTLSESSVDSKAWESRHRHCFVWKDKQFFKWYVDINEPGTLELFKSVPIAISAPLASGATLVMLQEQDAFGGGFDATQTMVGGIASFNLWNYAMTDTEIAHLPCIPVGNIINPGNIQYVGTPEFTTDAYPCKKLRPAATLVLSDSTQTGSFCRLNGCMLNNYVLSSTTVSTSGKCAMECLKKTLCVSSNYRISTGVCQLNYLRDIDAMASDFKRNMSSGYVHFTSRPC